MTHEPGSSAKRTKARVGFGRRWWYGRPRSLHRRRFAVTASTALVIGVRRHPAGPGFQVRIRPFPAETFATEDEANARAIELRRLRGAGILSSPRTATPTLAEAAESLLARKRVSGKRGPLTPKGIRHWEDSLKPWREGDYSQVP